MFRLGLCFQPSAPLRDRLLFVTDRAEIDAAEQIGQILAAFPSNIRGRILRRAVDTLDPKRSGEEALPRGTNVCAYCNKSYRRRSYNQRFCTYACGRDAGAQRRMATSALQFELHHGDLKQRA
jgi:hypothetical protein